MSWRPVFVQEFLDSHLDNVNAIAGRVVRSTPGPSVSGSVGDGTLLRPGLWFGYDFDTALQDVIGVDVMCIIHAPAGGPGAELPLVSLPNAIDVRLVFNDPTRTLTIGEDLHVIASVRVTVGTHTVVIDDFPVPHRSRFPFRVGWHTSGQLHLQVGSQLVAYESAVSPSQEFSIETLRFGDPAAPSSPAPRFFLHGATVRIMREDDALMEVLQAFPIDPSTVPDDERCARLVLDYQRRIIQEIRQLMRGFIAATTQPWRMSMITPQPTFDPSAVAAHDAADHALVSFMKWLDDPTEESLSSYLSNTEILFAHLHRQQPSEFKNTLMSVEQIPKPPSYCLDAAAQHAEANADLVKRLGDLAEATIALARRVGGIS